MTRRHWFLPEAPDVLGILQQQSAITVEGMDELVAWAGGDASAADRLRECEHKADDRKRQLRETLTTAFSTPLEPEDIYELSRGLDDILNSAKNIVGEAEAMQTAPDGAIAEMAAELADGTKRLAEAFTMFAQDDRSGATTLADRAVKDQRHLQHSYRVAMSALVEDQDLRKVTARRELYRRLARTGDALARVAERVWYSVLKER
jgi:Phosphate transport regulator (distant homolog of PhoU)